MLWDIWLRFPGTFFSNPMVFRKAAGVKPTPPGSERPSETGLRISESLHICIRNYICIYLQAIVSIAIFKQSKSKKVDIWINSIHLVIFSGKTCLSLHPNFDDSSAASEIIKAKKGEYQDPCDMKEMSSHDFPKHIQTLGPNFFWAPVKMVPARLMNWGLKKWTLNKSVTGMHILATPKNIEKKRSLSNRGQSRFYLVWGYYILTYTLW